METDVKLRTALGAGLAALALLSALSVHAALRSADAAGFVQHAREVELEWMRLRALVAEAESAARGLVLSDDDELLRPLEDARERLNASLGRLAALAERDRHQAGRVARVKALVDLRAARFDRVVAERGRGLEGARALLAAGEPDSAGSEIRAAVAAALAEERAQLGERSERARARLRTAAVAGGAGALVLAGTAALFLLLVRQDVRQRARTREALRAGEERFRLLVENVRDYALFMLDPQGRVTSWSAAAERLKGWREDEVLGRHVSIFFPPEAVEAGLPGRGLEAALRDGRHEEEGERLRRDGSRFWAHVVTSPLRGDDGALRGFVKVTRDITAARRAESERQALVRGLQRSNEELRDFAMIASHDLQEPLRKIQLFADRLAEAAPSLGAVERDYLERIRKAALRGQTLVDGLLELSRVSTRGGPAAAVDLGRVARDVVADLEAALARTGGRVELGPLPTVRADPLQMRQLLQNLIGNALKFHRAGVPPLIRVDAEPAQPGGARWRLRVADNGIGFDPRHAERIFKLFQRLHERGAYEGTGMGLALCRRIVERHGGTITARGEPGRGSTFLVELPGAAGEAPEPAGEAARDEAPRGPPGAETHP